MVSKRSVSRKVHSLRRVAISPKTAKTPNSKRGATPTRGPAAKEGDRQTSTLPRGFPTHAELLRLVALAKIKPGNQTHFIGNIPEVIQEAHIFYKLFHGGPKTYRAVLQRLRRIATHTEKLIAELGGVVEAGQSANADPEKTFTYDFLNEAVDRSPGPRQSNQRIAEHVQNLSDFRAVSQRAEQQAKAIWGRKGRPAGAGGNYSFDLFVRQLYLNARIDGGKFTNARTIDGQWSGSFIEALEILRPCLPDFFPPADLGRAVQNIVGKLRTNMKANRSQYRRPRLRTKNRRSRP